MKLTKHMKDLSGQRFGYLEALRPIGKTPGHNVIWHCKCHGCGNYVDISADKLRAGHNQSCGCQRYKLIGSASRTHGMTHTDLYHVWVSMKQRCLNPNHLSYKHYGALGVTICEEWTASSEAFMQWALVNGYRKGLSLDRIDSTGPYSPDNCRFVNATVQGRNRRRPLLLTTGGETRSLRQIAEDEGFPHSTIIYLAYDKKLPLDQLIRVLRHARANGYRKCKFYWDKIIAQVIAMEETL